MSIPFTKLTIRQSTGKTWHVDAAVHYSATGTPPIRSMSIAREELDSQNHSLPSGRNGCLYRKQRQSIRLQDRQNGMRAATLGGTWAHATLFDGYVVVNGTVYLHWMNSHGNRYKGSDRFDSPESGCWMTIDTLERFCSGQYVDAFCIYRAEAPVDKERRSVAIATFNLAA